MNMARYSATLIAIGCLAWINAAPVNGAVPLALDGQTDYSIVLPDDA